MINKKLKNTDICKYMLIAKLEYDNAKAYFIMRISLSIVLSIIYLLFINQTNLGWFLSISIFWLYTLVYLKEVEKSSIIKAATFQEKFDTLTYDIKWNDLLFLDKREYLTTYKNFKSTKTFENWYNIDITKTPNEQIIQAQVENLFYDGKLRNFYIKVLSGLILISILPVILIFINKNYDLFFYIKFILAISPYYIDLITTRKENINIQKNKKEQIKLIKKLIETKELDLTLIRGVQDYIYYSRQTQIPVPNLIYNVFNYFQKTNIQNTLKH